MFGFRKYLASYLGREHATSMIAQKLLKVCSTMATCFNAPLFFFPKSFDRSTVQPNDDVALLGTSLTPLPSWVLLSGVAH